MIEPLAAASGGTVLLYTSLDGAALPQARPRFFTASAWSGTRCIAAPHSLISTPSTSSPQDVYKCVARSRAFACMLRLRTSPELRVEGCHGRLVPDRQAGVGWGEGVCSRIRRSAVGSMPGAAGTVGTPGVDGPCPAPPHSLSGASPRRPPPACSEHSDLWRLVGCGPEDAFAFNLGRTTQRAACAAPAVQLVLQYSMLVPALPAAEGEAPGSRYALCCVARQGSATPAESRRKPGVVALAELAASWAALPLCLQVRAAPLHAGHHRRHAHGVSALPAVRQL